MRTGVMSFKFVLYLIVLLVGATFQVPHLAFPGNGPILFPRLTPEWY